MPTFTIDGKEISVEPKVSILQAALENGIHIPHFCYHPGLSLSGNCRMCLVEMEKAPKLIISCGMFPMDGQVIHTDTPKVLQARRSMMEFLLINHPLDCPVCDKAGECTLQDYSFQHGSDFSRFEEAKRVPPTKDVGDQILLVGRRCILCGRCARFCKEIPGTGELGRIERGGHTEINIYEKNRLDNPMSMCVVDSCPVGSLKSKDFLYKARVWNLDKTESVCPGCSTGCNINVETLRGQIYRITPRINMAVNTYWMCDKGRLSYHDWDDDAVERVDKPYYVVDGKFNPMNWEDVYKILCNKIVEIQQRDGRNTIAGIGSPHATIEENYTLHWLMQDVLKTQNVGLLYNGPEGEDWKSKSGFVIRAEKAPNLKGASIALGLIESDQNYKTILEKIERGGIKALYLVHDTPKLQLSESELQILKKLELLIVQTTTFSALTEIADIILPCASYVEREGTFANINGRVQKLKKALDAPGLTRDGWETIAGVGRHLGGKFPYTKIDDVFGAVSSARKEFANLSYGKISNIGLRISEQA